MLITIVIIVALFIIGAAVGSFTSVVIYRLHTKKRGILRGRSACPSCDKNLQPLDLVPVLSYLALRGKCRYCSKEISYMYPLLEIISGGLFACMFLKFPFLNEALQFSGTDLGMYLLYAFYTFVLIFTFFYDLHYLKIADEILLPAILIGLIATIATPLTPHFVDALIGAAAGAAFFGVQVLLSRGAWVGLGDLRLGAFMGVIFGWKLLIVSLVISYLLGSAVALVIVAKTKKLFGVRIPFGPLLVTGTFVTVFFGNDILNWYLKGVLGF